MLGIIYRLQVHNARYTDLVRDQVRDAITGVDHRVK